MGQRPSHHRSHQRGQQAGQQAYAQQFGALHLSQQAAARAQGPQYGEFTRSLLAGGGHCRKQHHQPGRKGKGKQKLNGPGHLVQHPLHLGEGAAHVHIGDVGKAPHQRIVKARRGRGLESTQVSAGHIGHAADRVHGKEVGTQRAPVHLAQRGDAGLVLHAANVKQQRIAQLQAQGVGQPVFHADGTCLFLHPAAGHHQVLHRLGRAVRQVELAVHQAAGTLIRVILGRHRPAVHGQQTAADHWVPVKTRHTGLGQRLAEGIPLLRHDVDDKAVGRIGRGGLSPAVDQVGAQQHQQHQRQQAHRQGTDLHHRVGRPGRDLARGQHQPARRRALVDLPAQQLDGQPAQQRKHSRGAGKAAHGDQAQCEVAAGGQQQGGKTGHAHRQHPQRGRFEPAHITPDHPQRRHLRELQHRRQAKSQQQGQAHAHAKQHRPNAGRRQGGIHQAGQQQHKHMVHRVAAEHA